GFRYFQEAQDQVGLLRLHGAFGFIQVAGPGRAHGVPGSTQYAVDFFSIILRLGNDKNRQKTTLDQNKTSCLISVASVPRFLMDSALLFQLKAPQAKDLSGFSRARRVFHARAEARDNLTSAGVIRAKVY